jgi:uncharacterized protein (TIGR02246 family)
MPSIHVLVALVLFLPLVGVQAQPDSDTALRTLVRQLVDAQAGYDAAALDRLLTADYVEVSPLGEVDARDRVLGFYRPELKPPPEKMTASMDVTDFSQRTYGDTAVVIVRIDATITSDGKQLPPRSLRATFVCRRVAGGWRMASAQYTTIRPAQGAAKRP